MSLIEDDNELRLLAIQNQFEEAARKSGWTDSRKLHSESAPFLYTEQGYSEMLPTYRGYNCEQLIQFMIDQSPNRSITIVDCGCGRRGAFLRSCAQYWRGYGRLLSCGITAHKTVTDEDERFLASENITIVEGDIHFVDRIVGENAADLIVSNFSVPYLADPWGAVLAINRSLKYGGVALVNYIPFGDVVFGGRENIWYFQERLNAIEGVEARIHTNFVPDSLSLSWQKMYDQLPIALSYEGHTNHATLMLSHEPFELDQVLYTIDC